MKQPEDNDTQYNRRYHLQRALKPILNIDSHKKTINMPQGIELSKTDKRRVDALVSDYGYVVQAVLDIAPYEKLMLDGSIGLKGIKLQFRKDAFLSLRPGAQVLRIGKGTNAAGNSVDVFKMAATYTGSILIDNKKYYAMRIHPDSLKNKEHEYYLLYEVTKGEIFRLIYKRDGTYNYTRFYKPEFKTAKVEKRKNNQGKLKL
jgi:hypothetical protein